MVSFIKGLWWWDITSSRVTWFTADCAQIQNERSTTEVTQKWRLRRQQVWEGMLRWRWRFLRILLPQGSASENPSERTRYPSQGLAVLHGLTVHFLIQSLSPCTSKRVSALQDRLTEPGAGQIQALVPRQAPVFLYLTASVSTHWPLTWAGNFHTPSFFSF